MGGSSRQAYLDAMGITAWVRLDAGGEARATNVSAEASESLVRHAGEGRHPETVVEPLDSGVRRNDASGEPATGELNWDELKARVSVCTRCAELAATRTQTVFGVGDHNAQWMVIGEAPGAEEDRQGEPFVGRAGQLLNNMLKAIGLQRETVFIANMIKCRPPGNRDPLPEEIANCSDYLQRQVALLSPKIILAVGRISAQNLLKTSEPLARLRGKVHRLGDVPLVVTYHPAYLLRTPGDKAKAWTDLRFARDVAEGRRS
jgi:DNA polymerase